MTNYRFFYIFSLILALQSSLYAGTSKPEDRKKIACVGDSLTYGYGLFLRERNSYPAQLEELLKENSDVRNFGINGACATPGRQDYYMNNGVLDIVQWKPDFVLIMLGSNDTKESNWISTEDYLTGMENIIYSVSTGDIQIILATPPPCRLNPFGIRDSLIKEDIIPSLEKLSKKTGNPLIDLYKLLEGEENIYIDNIHLNRKGYSIISRQIADYLNCLAQ